MPPNKTKYTDEKVVAFLDKIEDTAKKEDSYRLIHLMELATGEGPKMFGASIIGFGQYHYKYASGHEGKAPLIAFSPRKSAFSLYIYTGLEEHAHLIENLGKFTMGKACIYIKKLSDINEEELNRMMEFSINYISDKYTRIL